LRIEEMIISLELKAGEWLSEQGLSDRLGIGRTPIREALQQLTRDNLVDIQYRRGTVVRDIGPREQLTLLEVRKPLERLLVQRAATYADDKQRRTLAKLATSVLTASRARRFSEAMPITRDYYRYLYAASNQPVLEKSLTPLVSVTRTFFYRYGSEQDMQQAASLHRELANSIASKDLKSVDTAFFALFEYLERFSQDLDKKTWSTTGI